MLKDIYIKKQKYSMMPYIADFISTFKGSNEERVALSINANLLSIIRG